MTWRSLRHRGDPDDPRPIGASVERLAKSWGIDSPGTLRKVFADWDEIVGSQLAAHVQPLSLTDHVLVVAVSDPAWATQLKYMSSQLVATVNEKVGPGTVERVDVRVRSAIPRPR